MNFRRRKRTHKTRKKERKKEEKKPCNYMENITHRISDKQ
jgi:hypothetical protein